MYRPRQMTTLDVVQDARDVEWSSSVIKIKNYYLSILHVPQSYHTCSPLEVVLKNILTIVYYFL